MASLYNLTEQHTLHQSSPFVLYSAIHITEPDIHTAGLHAASRRTTVFHPASHSPLRVRVTPPALLAYRSRPLLNTRLTTSARLYRTEMLAPPMSVLTSFVPCPTLTPTLSRRSYLVPFPASSLPQVASDSSTALRQAMPPRIGPRICSEGAP